MPQKRSFTQGCGEGPPKAKSKKKDAVGKGLLSRLLRIGELMTPKHYLERIIGINGRKSKR